MLHISCHGDVMKSRELNKMEYFLAFEEMTNICLMDKITESRFHDLVKKGSSDQLKLVFVSACHSELIGQIFKRAGVPVVIAVNRHT